MRRGALTVAALSSVLVGAGCGSPPRQDADEPRGTWTVDVVEAKFPRSQRLAKPETMRIRVRNQSDRPIPNVAVTVDSFYKRTRSTGVAELERPVWVVDTAPRGGITAYTNTWALGKVDRGQTKTFEWKVTPVEAGRYRVAYRVAAGLDGKARARLASGARPEGSFSVTITREPSQARVDPDSGAVIRE